ncbi:hypothetical protein [Brevibacillus dissolubilis]|uniref:hypothetical protein n=1 Tax=Brevibacillus dissolubilis TaxID=1844116 RepID=UPI001117911D|nr:hypothetical protein [Brevibacillus dissolubilis]
MKAVKPSLLLGTVVLSTLISACSEETVQQNTSQVQLQSTAAEATPSASQEQLVTPGKDQHVSKGMLHLTEEENSLYEAFLTSHYDDLVLKQAAPLTIAKLYLHAEQANDWETQYELYIDDPEYVRWSREEHLQAQKTDQSANPLLPFYAEVDQPEFIHTSKATGYLKIPAENGEFIGFQMRQNSQGVWKVSFMPIQ